MVLFKDISKSSDELLSKGFVHEKLWDIEIKNKFKNPQFTQVASVSPTGVVAGKATKKIECPYGSTVSAAFSAEGTVDVTSQCPLEVIPGLTLSTGINRNIWKNSNQSAELAAELKRGNIHKKSFYNFVTGVWNTNATMAWKCVDTNTDGLFGYEVTGRNDKDSMKLSLGASVNRQLGDNTWSACVKSVPFEKNKFGKVSILFHAKSEKGVKAEMGVEVQQLIAQKQTNVIMGGQWWLSPNCNDTSVKAKIDHEGKVSACLIHKVHDNLTVHIGAQMHGAKWATGNDPALKYGVKLNLLA